MSAGDYSQSPRDLRACENIIKPTKEIQNTVTSSGRANFSEVVLDDLSSEKGIKIRTPKRILHFSDGILEEYSSEEDEPDTEVASKNTALLDTKSMTWLPYLWYLAWWFGSKTLAACDYMGENLASFFGITTPKYQFEIDEFERMKEEEEAEKKQEAEANAGWIANEANAVKIDLPQRDTNSVLSLSNEEAKIISDTITNNSKIAEKERY